MCVWTWLCHDVRLHGGRLATQGRTVGGTTIAAAPDRGWYADRVDRTIEGVDLNVAVDRGEFVVIAVVSVGHAHYPDSATISQGFGSAVAAADTCVNTCVT